MPPALADRGDAEDHYSQSNILRRCLQFAFYSSLQQAIPLTPEQSAIHQTYLTYIEPMIEYDFMDTVIASRRTRSRDDFTLLQEKLYSEALGKTALMRNVVQTWVPDQQLKNSLARLQEHISAVCTYELCKHWGQTRPEDENYMTFFYGDWLDELADEDADRSRRIALCIVVLHMNSFCCDFSNYPNLQAGMKDIVILASGRHRPEPVPVLDLT